MEKKQELANKILNEFLKDFGLGEVNNAIAVSIRMDDNNTAMVMITFRLNGKEGKTDIDKYNLCYKEDATQTT